LEISENVYKGIKIDAAKPVVKEEEVEKIITNLKEELKKAMDKDLDDEQIARWAGHADSAALRDAVRGEIMAGKFRERRKKIDGQVADHLLKNVKVDLPVFEIERHHKQLVDREIYNLEMRGVSPEDLDKYRKDVEENLKTVATDEIKLYYILETIAKAENIKAEQKLGEVVLGYILSLAKY
jgi:FKBP-type peptidyl-prolyl cis-trans isomerase (trigger factor)